MNINEKNTEEYEKIQILVFKMNETRIGINVEQISIILKHEEAKEKELQIFNFQDKLPFREDCTNLKSPRVLVLKEENMTSGIVVEQPEDIIHITIDSIQPLPPLIETYHRSGLFWGGTVINREIVILVDFYKLLEKK
ncbi:MAG: chemotaxis protein CheW [Candidatus Scalindua sp.]